METYAGKVSIDAPFDEVARLVADPARAHEWGTEFFSGPLRRADVDEWIAPVPTMGGDVRYRHEADPERGIMDVYLAPPGGDFGPPLPMRVVPNGDGADVIVVLARMPGTATERWEQHLRDLQRELEALKSLTERRS